MASGGSASSASDRVRCEGFLMKHESFFFFKKVSLRFELLRPSHSVRMPLVPECTEFSLTVAKYVTDFHFNYSGTEALLHSERHDFDMAGAAWHERGQEQLPRYQ